MGEAKLGQGAFQWNRGGWFGAQLGSTLWLVLLGCLLLIQSKPVGSALVLFGIIPNLVGYALWRRRDSLSPYPAVQGLIGTCGLFALLAMLALWAVGLDEISVGLPKPWFLLMYPGLMLMFHLQERSARKASA